MTLAHRLDHQLPAAVEQWRWQYHHLGIPTEETRPNETYIQELGMYVSGFQTSPFGVEWMRFEPSSPIPELVQTVPHLAFVVDDLEAALQGHDILIAPNSPSEGLTVAMIVHDGAPIELMEFAD